MQQRSYTLECLVADVRAASASARDEAEVLEQVAAIARRAVARKRDWLDASMTQPDAAQGFGFHLMHEEDDHSLALFVASWLAHRGTPPHDHGTWAVVVGLEGFERNTMWKRIDDRTRPGHAELAAVGDRLVGEGDVLAMREGAIHSVRNDSDRVTVSLHIYGRHVNHTRRSRFDPDRMLEAPYKVTTRGERALEARSEGEGADHAH